MYKHLTALPNATGYLELVQLDLTEEKDSQGWTEAFKGDVRMFTSSYNGNDMCRDMPLMSITFND